MAGATDSFLGATFFLALSSVFFGALLSVLLESADYELSYSLRAELRSPFEMLPLFPSILLGPLLESFCWLKVELVLPCRGGRLVV